MPAYKDELRTKKRKRLVSRLAFFVVVLVAGTTGATYLLFFARLVDVRDMTIETSEELRAGIDSTANDWLDGGFWQFTKRNNLFFLSGDALVSSLLGQFPELESAAVTKKFPHSLIISTRERRPEGIWCLTGADRCFYFDKNGKAFGETQPSDGFLVLNVIDQRPRELKLGDIVAEEGWTTNILKARELLAKSDVNVSAFIIPVDSFDEFHAKTAQGWKILFSNQTDIESQISSLTSFLKEKLTPAQIPQPQYIDLRIQDRIYYK